MRNAFVVLVSLCIGLASGFIVPSSAPEQTSHQVQPSTKTRKSKNSETKSLKVTELFAVLPHNRKDIDEKDLYEHAIDKQNNQSERAFIYINQKYKKPVRNRIFMLASPDRDDVELESIPITSAQTVTDAPQRPCVNVFEQGSSFFHEYEFPEKQDMSSYFSTNENDGIFRCNFNGVAKKVNDVDKVKPLPNRDDVRRDYFELLKPPILRPVNRGSNKAKYDSLSKNEFPSLASALPYKDYYLKKYNIKSQYVPKSTLVEERPADVRKNYGFNRPYTHHPAFRNKEIISRAEDVTFDGDFVNEDDAQRMYDNNPDEDKLLDKYLKDTLEEQGGTVDKIGNNQVDCNYRECILQNSKQYLNNGLLLKPECKCGRRLNIKQPETFFLKDRTLREESKRNDTIAKSSEMNYYEDMLTDDSNINNKIDDDVIRPPNKFNETSPR